MANLRPNAQRAKNAILLLWIVVGIYGVSLVSSYLQYDLLSSAERGEEVSEAAAESNDLREMVVGLLFLIAYILCAIFFIQWFRRAYYNLHQCVSGLNDSEGWAAGAWFVPILNLFKPYRIMKELYWRTASLLRQHQLPHPARPTNMVGWWWALWVIGLFADRISMRMGLRAESLDELIHATVSDMVCIVIGIPTAILAIQVIKGYAAMEPLLAQLPKDGVSPTLAATPSSAVADPAL